MSDPSDVAPNSLTYAEIDAREADSVRRANEALAACRQLGARWWIYNVSHCTFDMIVGDPLGQEENIAICCPATLSISGPVIWPNQQLTVEWTCDRGSDRVWQYRLIDERAGFRLESDMFFWRRNYDLHAQGSIWFSARARANTHLEYLCPRCDFGSYGYHPFCAECGLKLPSEAKMQGIGLVRPVSDPAHLLQVGFNTLRAELRPGSHNSDLNG